jgi:hypothetical protein
MTIIANLSVAIAAPRSGGGDIFTETGMSIDESALIAIIRESDIDEKAKNILLDKIDKKGALEAFIYPLTLEIRRNLDENNKANAEKLKDVFFKVVYQSEKSRLDDRRDLTSIRRDGPSFDNWDSFFDRGSDLMVGVGRSCVKGCSDFATAHLLISAILGPAGLPSAGAICVVGCATYGVRTTIRNVRSSTRSSNRLDDNRVFIEE